MGKKRYKILVVDDESDIREIIRYNLQQSNFLVEEAKNGEEAIRKAYSFCPHLILLDIMMPQKGGIQTLQELRKNRLFNQTAIVFLTALKDDGLQINGLNMGADDYLFKPIKPRLLISRIHAILRRFTSSSSSKQEENFPLQIDRDGFQIHFQGRDIPLPKKEFELLELLASRPQHVFTRTEILQKIWGHDVIVGDRTIDVHIRRIREKLPANIVKTVKGVGYKLEIR